jgi:hypothetical protein
MFGNCIWEDNMSSLLIKIAGLICVSSLGLWGVKSIWALK